MRFLWTSDRTFLAGTATGDEGVANVTVSVMEAVGRLKFVMASERSAGMGVWSWGGGAGGGGTSQGPEISHSSLLIPWGGGGGGGGQRGRNPGVDHPDCDWERL